MHGYGDYFALSLEAFRTEEFATFPWKDLDWQTISGQLEKEDLAVERHRERNGWSCMQDTGTPTQDEL
jgi:hypothetical protein